MASGHSEEYAGGRIGGMPEHPRGHAGDEIGRPTPLAQ